MRVIITNSYDEMSKEAAKIVAGQIYLKPDSVLGLATGSTPLQMYKKLIAVHEMVGLDFSQVTSFNLDEYIGMSPDNPQSYHYFMKHNFFDFINIKPENIFIPDGMAEDIEAEGKHYDALIEEKGGIDLQILGIGRNAHIGFNEPDIKFEATTHKVKLDDETIEANSRFFENEADVPRYAISMGIKTIMLAKKVVLLASGSNKAEAVYNAVYGSISPSAPASILQLHRDVTVIVDKEAGALLQKHTQA
ncbi:glucosamine-6-phosphate deaminase [Mitsuokella sp.]|uniref:glucosamine-6-phosphate deaminase n=1 Tax=Mitsuokella TaxID=52225 RepID=UPI0029E1F01F|nr:glucosamine-6-phosphate deaminase [Mitsuokella sp.]MDD6382286.1 glucosamine-6-phosphate deaminase [Selenomonadaceae bacterium]MDY4475563.1 glucosamine-6-phosphate deaminase [Mitsuokella sp.]